MLTMAVAFLFDTLIGDPRTRLHPVVLMGNLISWLERILLRAEDSSTAKLIKGGVLTSVVIGTAFSIGILIERAAASTGSMTAEIFIDALTLAFMISPRSLADAGREIHDLLMLGNIAGARRKVGWIVGRDTDQLSEPEIVRATVETIAENTVDGIISPLFYFLLGGLPFAIAYRAANTMDSMLGYKNEKYLYFGRAAARLDDILNLLPARLTALLFITSAAVLNLDYKNALHMVRRDADKHPSPNGGYAEAAVAGALNIRLGGFNWYFGRQTFRAYMGEAIEAMAANHILLAIRMMYTATILFLTFSLIFST
ncbi:MAG: cobalamin biosynthesis protein CobD [Selenomonadaceae bacterium]|nr:cobalamin biosynthesis protein CobD [Selenomonadaceae bacterium]